MRPVLLRTQPILLPAQSAVLWCGFRILSILWVFVLPVLRDPYYYDPYPYVGSYGSVGYAAPSQPVVIEQNIGGQGTAPASQTDESSYRTPDFYLIAFDNHTMRAALSYQVEGETIHWTSREHEQMSAPLATVDRRFSEQINRDRQVEFRLP